MVLLTRSRSQERVDRGQRGDREIKEGSHVVVLNGRHFPAFTAGDEGVVLRVDLEAQNCQVRFGGKAEAVQVALRHLRLTCSSPHRSCSAGEGTPGASPKEVLEATTAHHTPATSPATRSRGQAAPVEPSEYMDSTAGFAAGLAAVSGVVGQGGLANGLVNGAVVTQAEHPNLGLRHNTAGIADSPQGSARSWGAPHRGGPGGGTSSHSTARLPDGVMFGHMMDNPPLYAGYGSMPCASPSVASGAAVDADWRAARLEALEARLAGIEEEHRTEVGGLRHALEECVRAIGTCAQAIDAMCADSMESIREGGASMAALAPPALVGEWQRAASALHDAANLGMRALGGSASSFQPTRSAEPAYKASFPGPSSGSATPVTRLPSGTASPVAVEVQSIAPGSSPPPAGAQVAAPMATVPMGVPMQQPHAAIVNVDQRQYRVASPAHPPVAALPLHMGTAVPHQHLSRSSPRGNIGIGAPAGGGGIALVHGLGTAVWNPAAAALGAHTGAACGPGHPHALYPLHGNHGMAAQLVPPGNLLGSIPGLPALPGVAPVVPNAGRSSPMGQSSHFPRWSGTG